MNKSVRTVLASLMAGAGLLMSVGVHANDAFPTKPIRIVLGSRAT